MKTLTLLCFIILPTIASNVSAQDFYYGSVALDEITMTHYAADTSASAVVLKEFGEAQISNGDDYNLIFKYHVRIKVLKKKGLEQSNIEIPLYKHDNSRYEKVSGIKASSFNLEDNRIKEEVLLTKNIFREERNKYYNVEKFAIPNVRVGSVIEFSYIIESPFIFNFRSWNFNQISPRYEVTTWPLFPASTCTTSPLGDISNFRQMKTGLRKAVWAREVDLLDIPLIVRSCISA